MAVVVLAALAAFATPIAAEPAPLQEANWMVTLDFQPGRAQRVGQPFDVFFRPVVANPGFGDEATATYLVPDTFRILSASGLTSAGSGSGPLCNVTGQRIDCPINTGTVVYPRAIMVRLLPLVPGQNITSTISVTGEDSVEPDPDPNANEVSFATDVTSSLVDLSPSIDPASNVSVGETTTYSGLVENLGTIPPLAVSTRLEVPADFAITSAGWVRSGQDSLGDGSTQTGTCSTAGRVVTCDLSWLTPTHTLYQYGYYGQPLTWRIAINVTGAYTQPGTQVATTFSVQSTSPYQAEVNPDPHPNSVSTTVDVAASNLPSAVSGTVTDPGGASVNGATVLAYAPTDGFGPSGITTTGTDGTYTFDPLAPGSYALVYLPPAGAGYPSQWAGGSATRGVAPLLTVDGLGNAVIGIDEQFRAAISIAGTVRGPGGTPLSGIPVTAFNSGLMWFSAASTVSGPNGEYQLNGLTAGSYDVVFHPASGTNLLTQWYRGQQIRPTADPLILAPGTNATAVDADLVPGGSVSGTVTGADGSALPATRVIAYYPGDTWIGSYETLTAPDGSYTLPAMRTAGYQVRFVPPAGLGLSALWYANVSSRTASTMVHVSSSTTQTGIDATWLPAGLVP